jgi:5-(carboxyamino)imidazole ribonucleotide mutase
VRKSETNEQRFEQKKKKKRRSVGGCDHGFRFRLGNHGARRKTLGELGVPYETRVVSAHRTPDLLFEYASQAEQRGMQVIIAGAGGAAHLPGIAAAKTILPILGVPIESKALKGLDSLLSISQMPGGIPVGTMAIGKAGAINAALLATAILGVKHPEYREALRKFRKAQTEKVLANPDPAVSAAGSAKAASESPQGKKHA